MASGERIEALDVVRGFALFGVLMVNLLTLFRVSLFHWLDRIHTHPGLANHVVDLAVLLLLEMKSLSLFSFLFGVGLAAQAERAGHPAAGFPRLAARRLAVLLGVGLVHKLLVWNGDILTFYALGGAVILPLVRREDSFRLALGLALVLLVGLPTLGFPAWNPLPQGAELERHTAEALRVYGSGGYRDILAFRLHETWHYMAPLLAVTFPRLVGLMLLGVCAWRLGVFQRPAEHLELLATVLVVGLAVGGPVTVASVIAAELRVSLGAWHLLLGILGPVGLALAYGAGLLLLLENPRARRWLRPLAPLGRMAFTHYLLQSVVLGFLFYGYGLGLFGRLGSAVTALLGLGLYALQVAGSAVWLRHFHFGPVEWVWRCLTYGQRQPLRRRAG